MLKHKEGTVVRIIAQINGHGFNIGDVVTITELINEDGDEPHYEAKAGAKRWWISDEECEPIEQPKTIAQ